MEITRHKKGWRLHAEQWLPLPPDELWAFFADAHNLDAITPNFLHFEVLTPKPIEMRTGTLIDYRLRLHGLPIRWRSEIKAWEPPTRFIDEQTSGPYKRWRHEHILEALAGGTNYIDDVYYELHGGPLAGFLNRLIVERDVAAIFAYRRDMLDHLFGGDAPNAARRSEKRPPSEGVVRFAGGPCETRSPHSDGIGREGYQRCPSDV